MISGPAFAGATQCTRTLVSDTVSTSGAAGVPGCSSSSSVTVTVSVCSARFSRSPVPLLTSTTTRYSLLPAAFAGSVLSTSCASSKFGAAWNVSAPVPASIPNRNRSAPPVTA